MAAVVAVAAVAAVALQRTTVVVVVVVRQLVPVALVPGRTAGITCAHLPRGNTQAAR